MKKLPPNRRWPDAIKYQALTAVGLLCASMSHALVVNVDIDDTSVTTFSGQGAYADSGNDFWNSSANGLNNLTASDGVTSSSIDLAISTTSLYNVIGGNIPAGQSHSNLVGDYSYARNTDITVDISGLEPSEPYRLYIYCQGDQLSQNATVTFPGNSSVSTTGLLDGSIGEGQNYVVMDVTADTSGNISGTIARNGSSYVAINGIQIVELDPAEPRTFVHPGIGLTADGLDAIKANLDVEPWKTGYEDMLSASQSSLDYIPYQDGTLVEVGRLVNNSAWESDMKAIHNMARLWYFTGNEAYAQKGRDILISWASTHTSWLETPNTYLVQGYHAWQVFEGADILRSTWSGWTEADTQTCKTYFADVCWKGHMTAVPIPLRSANQGMAQFAPALGIAIFNDDEEKFEQCLKVFRADAAAALGNTLPNGQIGDTGRDSHDQGQLMLMAWAAEAFWNQGVDVYSEDDNRLLAAAEYISRHNLLVETPFIQAGTVYDVYPSIHAHDGPYANTGVDKKMLNTLYTAYVTRKGMRAPYLEQYLSYATQDADGFCYLLPTDTSTAIVPAPIDEPAAVASVTSLNQTNLGDCTSGSATYNASNKTWTVTGQGSSFSDSSADLRFAYLPVTGDATIIAKLTSISGSDNNARAGVLITDTLDENSDMHAIVITNPNGNEEMYSFWRDAVARSSGPTGGSGTQAYATMPDPKVPYWIKIERIGNRVNSYSSPDGASWSCGQSADYAFSETAYIGLAVSSDDNSSTATATFTDVRITGGDGGEAIEVPAAPHSILASPAGDQIPLRWLESFEADSYNIWRSTQSGGPYTLLTQESGTSYIDTSVDYGTHYYYAVSAVNSVGESPLSPEAALNHVDTSWYEAESYDAQSGFGLESTIDNFGGQNLSNSHAGDWVAYYDIPLGAGAVFKGRMASYGTEIGQIEVRLGSTTGTLVGTLPGLNTGGAQSWGSDEVALSGYTAGVYDIYLVFTAVTGETGVAMNLNWFDITYPNVTEYDLGMDTSLAYNPASHALTNLGEIPEWGVVSTHLKLQDGSDLSNVDFAALGMESWTTNDFVSSTTTTWDGANLSGLTLYTNGNFGAGDSFAGADFSNIVWGNATSSANLFSGGSGATSAATQENAINLQGADLSLITGSARTTMIQNLGGFDGATPIGAQFDPVFIERSGWDSAAMVAAGWQYNVVDAFSTIEAETFDDQFGVSNQTSSEGGLNVQAIQNGDWCAYYNVDFGTGVSEFQARVASATSGGNIEIRLDSPTGTLIGTCPVTNTGGWQSWATVETSVSGASGIHDLYIVFTGGSGYLFNLNWIVFNDGIAQNEAPVATPVSASVNEDSSQAVTLTGTDANGDTLTASIVSQPTHGSVSLSGNVATYQPTGNYNGSDSFTFTVNDGALDSAPATVSMTVNPVNDAPNASSQSVSTAEDVAKAITLTGSDIDGDSLSYSILTQPTKGSLSGSGANRTYTPNANANGSDSFTFRVNDGTANSATATVSITVTAVNDAPVASSQSVSTSEDIAKAITLAGSDVDGDALSYTVLSSPGKGSLSGSGSNRIYTPNANANGSDSFSYRVNDGTANSATATVSITVTSVNDAPVFSSDSYTGPEADVGVAYDATLDDIASDVDGDSLTYSKQSGPDWLIVSTTGELSGMPTATDSGLNTWTLLVVDSNGGSDTATLEIMVNMSAGLVAQWAMNEGTGTSVSDTSGNGFAATAVDCTWMTGVDGNALDLNGSTSRVTLPTTAFASVSDEVSIAMWVYGDTSLPKSNSVFYATNANGNRLLNVHLPWNNSQVYWDAGDSTGYDRINKSATAAEYKDGWNHWIFTKNATTGVMNIYLNGALWHTGTGKSRSVGTVASAVFGGQISSLSYDGVMDDVLLYNVELTAAEVTDLYGYYSMDLSDFTYQGDVGSTAVAGSASYSDGVYTIAGSGADIWGTVDAFYFASQARSGDTTISASVTSLEAINVWSKAGVMFRDSLDANAMQVSVIVRPDNQVSMQWRSSTGGSSSYSGLVGDTTNIKWVKLDRVGDVFTGYYSIDGVNWTTITSITVGMSASPEVGMAVTSHNNQSLCTSTFTDVVISEK